MSTVLGRDHQATSLARFGGRLQSATLTRVTRGALNPSDPTGGNTASTSSYACEGVSFRLRERLIDGERVTKRDFVAALLRGSISSGAVMPQVGDSLSITPPGSMSAVVARVEEVLSVSDAFVTLRVRGPSA